MTPQNPGPHHGTTVLRRYSSAGAWLGGALGIAVAAVVTGQHVKEWPLSQHLIVLAASVIGGVVVGYVAGFLASPTGSPAEALESANTEGSEDP